MTEKGLVSVVSAVSYRRWPRNVAGLVVTAFLRVAPTIIRAAGADRFVELRLLDQDGTG